MGIKEKLTHAKKTDWIKEGFTDEEVREIVSLQKMKREISEKS